ncbi:MAG: ROK family glucokinase [Clostridia bacterium]|nr:ROK family glucokinase [Clostridia bacterium]MEE1124579.1 ROK family glucokinase [Acutalibacteraceae bacterium]
MKKYAFGVDIGGTTIKMGFFETTGTLLEKWEIPTRTEENGVNILPDIAVEIDKKLAEKSIEKADIEGIGVGVPGPVDDDGTVFKCVNLGWGVFNVEIELNRLTELKVKVGNDANVAALGEMWQGGGKGYKNIVMVTLGTGVGGGVIINEKIVCGSNGAGGEIGHINMKENEKDTCGCGNRGCLEQYASATGIVRTTKKYLEEHPEAETVLKNDEITAKAIFDAAKADDEVAIKMVDKTAKILGRGLSQIACVVNPQVFVIGGGMSKAGAMLIEKVQGYYQQYAFHAARDTYFKLADLGNDAGIYGGVRMILD